MKSYSIIIVAFLLITNACVYESNYEENKEMDEKETEITAEQIEQKIDEGKFTEAENLIDRYIASNKDLTETELYDLKFEKARMDRIRRDFNKSEAEVLEKLKKYYPGLTTEKLRKWEDDNLLEVMLIDDERRYFGRAVSNLFHISAKERAVKEKLDGIEKDSLKAYCRYHAPKVIDLVKKTGKNLVHPVDMRITYTVKVKPNMIPDGEVIRCWMPFPREDNPRQTNVKLLSANVDNYIISTQKYLHRSIYMEKTAKKDQPTVFTYQFEMRRFAQWHDLKAEDIKPYDKNSEVYKKNTQERPPHIVFSERIKKLSDKITGDETNPLLKVEKIYTWIDENIPWAGAREYSTVKNIPKYVLDRMHGDCGMQTLLFISLARYQGIPVKWQSGWMLHPGNKNLHDWCEVYYEGIGWVPLDQSFERIKSDDPDVKDFYIHGIDAYRLIVNDDFSRDFYPAKIYPRSETVDFQRGEVEWRGGNLYFGTWRYNMKIEYLK